MVRLLFVVFALVAGPLRAHEFWLEPHAYQIDPGEAALADARVGENMKGATYSYLPPNFTRFEIYHDGQARPVEGRAGDLPAFNMVLDDEGLHVVVHVTKAFSLTYKEWEKFLKFAKHKDFPTAAEVHLARGLPEQPFKERYIRFVKTLIAVGDGAGADLDTGMLTEIVAEANPYTDDVSGGVPVRVLYEGAPRGDAQVELFDKDPDGAVEVTLHRTDADGRVTLPVTPGHSYLVDAVVLRPVEPEGENGAVWETLWAGLTFAVPG